MAHLILGKLEALKTKVAMNLASLQDNYKKWIDKLVCNVIVI